MSEVKKRHGCLEAILIFLLIGNALAALTFLVGWQVFKEDSLGVSKWTFPVLGVLAAANVLFAIALFKWKKMGFWGLIVTTLVGVSVQMSGGYGIGQSLLDLIGVVLLYGVLHIGKENNGWQQLE